jgi:hypothetical protein
MAIQAGKLLLHLVRGEWGIDRPRRSLAELRFNDCVANRPGCFDRRSRLFA